MCNVQMPVFPFIFQYMHTHTNASHIDQSIGAYSLFPVCWYWFLNGKTSKLLFQFAEKFPFFGHFLFRFHLKQLNNWFFHRYGFSANFRDHTQIGMDGLHFQIVVAEFCWVQFWEMSQINYFFWYNFLHEMLLLAYIDLFLFYFMFTKVHNMINENSQWRKCTVEISILWFHWWC